MRTRPVGPIQCPRLRGRLAFALALLLSLVALAPGMRPVSAAAPACLSTYGSICLISISHWTEHLGFGDSEHIVGQIRNDGADNRTGIQVTIKLDGVVPTDTVPSAVEILGPGDVSPFEDLLFPIPPGYSGTFHVTGITSAVSDSQPLHIAPTMGTNCVAGEVCGQVDNPSGSVTLQNVRVILTFDDGHGGLVEDVVPVDDGTIASPGSSTFSRSRAGEPAGSLVASVAEPVYPVDLSYYRDPAGTLAFGAQLVDTSSPAEPVTLRNIGELSMVIDSIATTGDFLQTNNCPASPATLAANGSCTINVVFHPASPRGTVPDMRSGSLVLHEQAPGSPQTVALSGRATAPTASLSPSSLSFDPQPIGGTSAPKKVTLTNGGDGPLLITGVTVNSNFAIASNACGASLAPGTGCDITVSFRPTTAGALSGALSISDNAPGSPHQAQLHGTGLGPGVELTPSSLTFGSQTVGSTSDPQTVTLRNTGNARLSIAGIDVTGDFSRTQDCGSSLDSGESCSINVSFRPSAAGSRSGSLTVSANAPSNPVSLNGLGAGPAAATYSASSTDQYRLSGLTAQNWQEVDPRKLELTIPAPSVDGMVVLGGNADLWTETSGVNQDIGIWVSIDGGLDQLVAWKESGGNAGTFSPNAAFVQAIYPVSHLHRYVVKLKWKTNIATAGAIRAGAGIGPTFSPTSVTAKFLPSGISGRSSTSQYRLAGAAANSWQNIDGTNLALTIPAGTSGTALLGGNADLWTEKAGVNQDLGIFVNGSLVAWKESGGFAGTFSPNAAFVQTTFTLDASTSTLVELRWKTNVPTNGAIRAGAGLGPQFSPTTLTVVLIQAPSAVSTRQYTLAGNDGQSWQPVDPSAVGADGSLGIGFGASGSPRTVIVSGNADLWTEKAGVNQDLGIFVDGQLVAWKESGGRAGTFSPNAAFVQAIVTIPAFGPSHFVELKWKTNVPTSGRIHMGAGLGPAFSPTSLTMEVLPE